MADRYDTLSGRTVVITGASAGCGLGIAERFADAGASVVMIARNSDQLNDAANGIRQRGCNAKALVCDVTNDYAVATAFASLSRLDVLINNAGTNIPEPFLEVRRGSLLTLLELNLGATFSVTRHALTVMRRTAGLAVSGGAIVNIGSQMGHIGSPGRSAYCATKHGIEGLTKAWAVELAAENIRVNCVAPTFVDTPLIRRIVDTAEKKAALFGRIPLGRLASVEDVAAAALFLASPEAASITGTSLKVDGGWCAG